MKEQLIMLSSTDSNRTSGTLGNLSGSIEESKSPNPFGNTSIALAKQRFADGGSGSINFAPIVVETSVPPTYVSTRVKAHEIGGCVAFRP